MTAKKKKKKARLRAEKVLVLRTICKDGVAYGGFRHPMRVGAYVEAKDWDPADRCGGGIHGLLRGEGTGALLSWDEDALWQVYEVEDHCSNLVKITVNGGNKCKFRRGRLVYLGARAGACEMVQARHPTACVVGGSVTANVSGTVTAPYRGTAVAGTYGTAVAGTHGTAVAGTHGTAVAGTYGTATAMERSSVAVAGTSGTARVGDYSVGLAGEKGMVAGGASTVLVTGVYGKAVGGHGSVAIAGAIGGATVGDRGMAVAGPGGTVMGGAGSVLILVYRPSHTSAPHVAVARVGERGIKPNVRYKVEMKRGRPVFVED